MANLSNINNKFLVTTGGNVLIGQTTAIGSSIFQVTGDSTFTPISTVNFIVTNSGNALRLIAGLPSGATWVGKPVEYYASEYSFSTDVTGAGSYSQQLVIENNGDVGIGVSSPIKKLQVSSFVAGDLINILCVNRRDQNGDTASIGFSMTDNNLYNKAAVIFERTTTQGRGSLHFATNNVNSSANVSKADARMTILSGGNVGIGTTSPVNKLQIAGTVQTDDQGRFKGWYTTGDGLALETGISGSDGYLLTYNRDTSAYSSTIIEATGIQFVTHSSGKFYFQGGNVGIGTTSPTAPLMIAGSGADGVAMLRLEATAGYQNFNWMSSSIYPNLQVGKTVLHLFGHAESTNNQAHIGFKYAGAGSTSNMFSVGFFGNDFLFNVLATGNVGIGTTSPSKKLEVVGDIGIAVNQKIGWIYNKGADNNMYNYLKTAIASGVAASHLEISGANWTSGNTASVKFTHTSQTPSLMTLMTGGNVGIGTDSPTYPLEINSAVTGGGMLSIMSTGVEASISHRINSGATNTGWVTGNYNADYFIYSYTLSGQAMTFKTSGNVGIGTTNPSSKLVVAGDAQILTSIIGASKNYATSQGWLPGAAGTFSGQKGYYGGDFSINGAASENSLIWGENGFGQRALQWQTIGEAANDADGGWNKGIDGLPDGNTHAYMSYVYVKRTSTATTGTFYYGCATVLNLSGNANSNPYFHVHNIGSLPQDVWCLAIGIIQAHTDTNTGVPSIVGIYRVDTGVKILGGTSFRSTSGVQTTQSHRTYHYYSTNPAATLAFANPGFYVIDGTEPNLSTLVNQ